MDAITKIVFNAKIQENTEVRDIVINLRKTSHWKFMTSKIFRRAKTYKLTYHLRVLICRKKAGTSRKT